MSESPRSEILVGVGSSHGVAIARAVVLGPTERAVAHHHVAPDRVDDEWERFKQAVNAVQSDLQQTLTDMPEGRAETAILEAYLMMAGDEIFADGVQKQIRQERRCAEWAVDAVIRGFVDRFSQVEDAYMRERSHDIEFVGQRLLGALRGGAPIADQLDRAEPTIIIAHDLSPADTAAMSDSEVVAFVTEVGSRTSHTSIMARALEIPAVVGVNDAVAKIGTGDLVIVDGLRGRVTINPDEAEVSEAERRDVRYQGLMKKLGEHRDELTATRDGHRAELHANIELSFEARLANEHGAEGIGLYRTEYLYVDRIAPPSEQEQYETYREVIEQMEGHPVVLRTFDIGGDKFVSTFPIPEQLNPMLGLRAVRLALSQPELFMDQLRAMVRASAHGEVRVLIPMVATLGELHTVRSMLGKAHEQVRSRGQDAAENIPLGVMIEVPAAAIMADLYAREADFLSIGTNDLVQYALAIDRTNPALAHLASPFEPGVLRLIAGVIEAGQTRDCPVSLCGEMASDPLAALLLLGMGLRTFSMESVAVPEIKETFSRFSLTEVQKVAKEALLCGSRQEVEQLLNTHFEGRILDLLTGEPELSPDSQV